jgi:hypothetical protein
MYKALIQIKKLLENIDENVRMLLLTTHEQQYNNY